MDERRKAPRIKEESEVTINVVSGEKHLPKEKIIYNHTKDISVSGAKLRGSIILPIDTILKIDFISKTVREQINAIGKVKWVKVIIDDWSYEAGVEFVGTLNEAIKKLGDYISWKQKSDKA
jgi:PilZ domain.